MTSARLLHRALGIALMTAACATSPAPPASDAGVLVRSEEIAGDFLLEQEIRFRWPGGAGTSRALVQQLCGRLTVVLLTPFGTTGVVLRQEGEAVTVEDRAGVSLPLDPHRVLRDIHRSLFVPVSGPPLHEGRRAATYGGERIEESWSEGMLVARAFHVDSQPPETVIVSYPAGVPAHGLPTTLSIDGLERGYRLDVSTVSRLELTCRSDEALPASSRR